MRIGCLQFSPQVGDVDNNLNRADAVLSKANPQNLDLLVLPELAFSGYNFKSLQEISPFLEHAGSGISSLWARTIALKYDCYVAVGYPEKVDVSSMWPTGPEYYNSAIVINADGETVANYRKSFLYYTDETWALEGDRGFYDGNLPGLGNTSIGICMDLNPYKFEAPWDAFEFAFHVLEVESNLVIVSMAWMTREEPRKFSRTPNEPDMDTLTYWVTRLEPLIREENEDEIIVIFCNRTGTEGEAVYAGTSAVLGIKKGEVKVYGLLGRGQKELLVVDTKKPPFARLAYDDDVEEAEKKSVSFGELPTTESRNEAPADPVPGPASTGETEVESRNPWNSDGSLVTDKRNSRSHLTDGNRSHFRDPSPDTALPQDAYTARLPPLPTLPDDLKTEVKEDASKRRQAPSSIYVPPPPGITAQGDHLTSPGTDGSNFPTPSAPSPTPMAIRPKLIIPQSPSGKIYEYTPEQHCVSAISELSERSLRSVLSEESAASVQTIRSNPRPPEDSTPYPHSGQPLSGYPTRGRTYGGQHLDASFTPTTPFDDISPASTSWSWKPDDDRSRFNKPDTPWRTRFPIGRKAEPFPWSTIRPSSRSRSRGASQTEAKCPEVRQSSSQYAQTSTSASQNDHPISSNENRISPPQDLEHERALLSSLSRKPSSSRMRHTSVSPAGEANKISAETIQYLEDIAQRSEALNAMRADASAAASNVNKSLSTTTSRTSSRSRFLGAKAHFDGDPGFHEKAGSGMLKNESRSASPTPGESIDMVQKRPVSLVANTRSSSFTPLNNTSNSPSTSSYISKRSVRSTSRGRQPYLERPSNSGRDSPHRAPSVDTVQAKAYYSQFRRHSANLPRQRRSRRSSQGTSSRSRRHRIDLRQFECIEAVRCPNCPVHGQRAASTQNTEDVTPTTAALSVSLPSNLEANGVTLITGHTQDQLNASAHAPENSSKEEKGDTETVEAKQTNDMSRTDGSVTSTDSRSEPEFTINTLLQAYTRPRSAPTMVPFDPTTPKAMSFVPNDVDPLLA